MAYIGRGIDKLSNIEKLDTITFDGSSSYSLTKNSVAFTPSSANSLQVSIDGVVQAGNFTVSGSTIDFGTAVASTSTNDFIFHYGTGLITTPADGTVDAGSLSADAITGQTAESSAADADTILIHDDSASALRKMTRSNFLSGVGGANTPAWSVTTGSDQAITSNSSTTVQFNTENFDVGGVFDTSTYKATPTSGKYFISFGCSFLSGSSSVRQLVFRLKKNTTTILQSGIFSPSNIFENATNNHFSASGAFTANGTDTFNIEVYYYDGSGTVKANAAASPQNFSGFKIIE